MKRFTGMAICAVLAAAGLACSTDTGTERTADTMERNDMDTMKGGGTLRRTVWHIDNLENIGGHDVEVVGDPKVVDTPGGKAVEFDGVDDGLIIDNHPLAGAREFTLEVIFRPDAGGRPEQRFFHLQERETDNRYLIETRLSGDGDWWLDTFLKTGDVDQTLVDPSKLHPVGEWYNATLVYDGNELRHYVNGVQEIAAEIGGVPPQEPGRTSAGVRMNLVHWFKGAIRQARFTRGVLAPEDFLKP